MGDPAPTLPPSADDLLRHAEWVRRLARTLVGDADAEDVVQSTWLAALSRPPRSRGSLPAWLSAVARNFARQHDRGDRRRQERERATARTEALPATADVVERAALHRAVVEQVLSLAEPNRTTLLLRFFDDLPTAEIAARQRTSEEAIRQRVKRGLDELRARLDAANGGDRKAWIVALSPLCGLPAAKAAAVAGLGGATMVGVKSKLVVGSAVVAALALSALMFGWLRSSRSRLDGERAESQPAVASATSSIAESDAVATTAPATERAEEVAAPASRETIAASGPPIGFVYGAVVDASGVALPKAEISVRALGLAEPDMPARDRPWSTTAEDGAWSVAGLRPARYEATAQVDGFAKVTREFTIVADHEGERVDFVLTKACSVPIRLRSIDGGPLAAAFAGSEFERKDLLQSVAVIATVASLPPRLPMNSSRTLELSGIGRWYLPSPSPYSVFGGRLPVPEGADGLLVVEQQPPFFVSVVWKHVVLATQRVDDAAQPVDFVIDPDSMRLALARVMVRLVAAASAQPVSGIQLRLGHRQGGQTAEATSGPDGIARFEDVAPGLLGLEYMGGPYGWFFFLAPVEAGADVDLGTVELSPPTSLAGRVTDADGKPMRVGLSWVDLDHFAIGGVTDYYNSASTDESGAFVFERLNAGRYLVRAFEKDHAIAPVVVDLRQKPLEPVQIRLLPGTPVTFEPPWKRGSLPAVYELRTEAGELIDASWGLASTMRLLPNRYRLTIRRGATVLREVAFEVGDAPSTVTVPPIDDGDSGVASRPAESVVPPDAKPTPPSLFPDPVALVCYGRVVAATDRGLVEGSIQATLTSNRVRSSEIRNGCFALAGVTACDQDWDVWGRNGISFFERVRIAPVPAVQRRDFVLKPGIQLTVVLIDPETGGEFTQLRKGVGGSIPPAFCVIATREPPDPSARFPSIDRNRRATFGIGRFSWIWSHFASTRGVLDVDGELPIYVSLIASGQLLHSQRVEDASSEVRLPIDWDAVRRSECSLRVRLVDAATGLAIRPQVLAVTDVGTFSMKGGTAPRPLDDSGTFELAHLSPVACQLYVDAPGYEPIRHEITLEPGHVNDLGELALGHVRHVLGRIVDGAGRGVKCDFNVRDAARFERTPSLSKVEYWGSDEEGRFDLEIGSGPHQLFVRDDRFAATCVTIDAASGVEPPLVVTLVPGTPVVVAVEGRDSRVDRIEIRRADGGLVASRQTMGYPFRLQLEAGNYVATGFSSGEVVDESEFAVGAEPVEVTLVP